ncbi:MAG: arginine--tRNA ligase, partial [Candidatus Brocadiaceae bacterium]
MQQTRSIEELIAAALAAHVPLSEGALAELLETPPSAEMGDYGLPCFTLSKYMQQPPNEIAEELLQQLEPPPGVARMRTAGPYLNFFVDRPAETERLLTTIHELASDYGSDQAGSGRAVVLDYGSPNIAKHLAIHHLPSAVIGRALYRIYAKLGYETVGINFLGDWGTAFGRLIAAVERYGVGQLHELTVSDLQELYVRYSREAEGSPELQGAARRAFRRLEQGEPAAREIWEAAREVSLQEFDRVYGRLGVE